MKVMEKPRVFGLPGPSGKALKALRPEHVQNGEKPNTPSTEEASKFSASADTTLSTQDAQDSLPPTPPPPIHNIQCSSSSLPNTSAPTQNTRDTQANPPPATHLESPQVPPRPQVPEPPPSSNTKASLSLLNQDPQPHPSSIQLAPTPPLSQSSPEIPRKALKRRVKSGVPPPLAFMFELGDYQTPNIAHSHLIQDHPSPQPRDNFDQAPNPQQPPTMQLADSLVEHMSTNSGPNVSFQDDAHAGFDPTPSTPKRAQGNKRGRSTTTSPGALSSLRKFNIY
ncbi:hypothetical protein BD779DRAFT_1683815 [Infundibulicybe gibba]|nr:hypothetical protein BD779DRAFT_1683815 [Infundibulicybe gibba]